MCKCKCKATAKVFVDKKGQKFVIGQPFKIGFVQKNGSVEVENKVFTVEVAERLLSMGIVAPFEPKEVKADVPETLDTKVKKLIDSNILTKEDIIGKVLDQGGFPNTDEGVKIVVKQITESLKTVFRGSYLNHLYKLAAVHLDARYDHHIMEAGETLYYINPLTKKPQAVKKSDIKDPAVMGLFRSKEEAILALKVISDISKMTVE